jgi:membrane-associated phospholipid phosphatase
MKPYILIYILIFAHYSSANYDWNQFKTDYSSPYTQIESRTVLYTGSALTALLILFKDGVVEPFQQSNAKNILDEDVANFGDLMGQVVPNALYMGGTYLHYKLTGNKKSLGRTILMFKTTALAGGTTTILKRIVNQRRPHKGDHLSFPSGHTTTAFAFASVVAMEHKWYWGVGAYTLATVVGMSRIHDNAHYLHDVVFGATLGTAFGIGLYHLQNKNDDMAFSIVPIDNGASIATSFKF